MNPRYPAVARRARHRCEYCGAPEAIFNFPFEVEHVVPVRLGGADEESNWALACRSCNVFKSGAVEALDPATEQPALLFHPRQHRREEHFAVEPETGALRGLSPTGRATVARLRINSESQLLSRRLWMRLGLFP